ncbi:MAG: hypothetical protein PUI91_05755 [Firmicutes bacterium]|nr:hypothetical protein [Bacillota bacterium]
MMKRRGHILVICIPIILGFICLILSFLLSDSHALACYSLKNLSLALLGVSALIAGIIYGAHRGYGKKDWKFLIAGILIGLSLLTVGGKNLVYAGLDNAQDPVTEQLTGCTISDSVSLKRLFSTYYLEGVTEEGKEIRLIIDKSTYYTYNETYEFQAVVTYREHTRVAETIMPH